jgi:hypothetical protein
MENVERDDRLAEAAHEIYRIYGNNLQRYFDDLLGKTEAQEQTSRCVDLDSNSQTVGERKNGSLTRVP